MTEMTAKKEVRIWQGAPARYMGQAEGYVMVRRKGAAPFVLSLKEWESAPLAQAGEGADISDRMLRAGSSDSTR